MFSVGGIKCVNQKHTNNTIILYFTRDKWGQKWGKSHCPDNGLDKLDVSSSLIPVSKNVTSFFPSQIVN